MARYALATLLVASVLSGARGAHDDDDPAHEHDDKWYPQNGSATTCKQNVESLTTISWMKAGTTGFGPATPGDTEGLEDCCAEYYSQGDTDKFATCVEDGGGDLADIDVSTGTWRVDWTVQDGGRCVLDCPVGGAAECGGAVGGEAVSGIAHHATPQLCCDSHYGHLTEAFCVAEAYQQPFNGGNQYYIDSSTLKCFQDCPEGTGDCGGVVKEDWVALYADLATCCANTNAEEYCLGQADGVGGTDKWYYDGNVCYKDCLDGATGAECSDTATGWTNFHDTATDCCANGLGWVNQDWCVSRSQPDDIIFGSSAGYTFKWAVDYEMHLCVKDCDPTSADPACGVVDENGPPNALFETAEACCDQKLGYKGEECAPSSVAGAAAEAVGNNQWYADYASARRCVMNCAEGDAATCGGVVANSAGVSFYASAAECCESKFGWYNQPLCVALAEGGGTGYTNQFRANYQTGLCEQDCAEGSGNLCAGNPTDLGMPHFETIDECCSTKLGWTADTCKTKTAAVQASGAAAADQGSGLWKVDWQSQTCSRDCAADDAAFDSLDVAGENLCGGVSTDQSVVTHDTLEACCGAHYSWIDTDLCASLATGVFTDKWYADEGSGVCHQHCAEADGEPCAGNPAVKSSKLYADAATCCSSAVGWVNPDVCAQTAVALTGTDDYYIDWAIGKCVQNCDKTLGGDCGGIAENYNDLFGTLNECCEQPHFLGRVDPDEHPVGCLIGS